VAGTALPCGPSRDAQRLRLIEDAIAAGADMVGRLHRCKDCRSVLPLADAMRMPIEKRLTLGDNLAAYDVIVEARDRLTALLPQLGLALIDDAVALDRLRELERLKPVYGSAPIIAGGRQAGEQVNQETAGSEASGKECRRTGTCAGACPRATGGQRERSESC